MEPTPDFFPPGGLFMDRVDLILGDADATGAVEYAVRAAPDGSSAAAPWGADARYTAPIALPAGTWQVRAHAVGARALPSANVTEQYTVVACGGDECCQWRVIEARFTQVRQGLLRENASLTENSAAQLAKEQKAQSDWLRTEAHFLEARNSAEEDAKKAAYALGEMVRWREATRRSEETLAALEKEMARRLRAVLDERALIRMLNESIATVHDSSAASPGAGPAQESAQESAAGQLRQALAQDPALVAAIPGGPRHVAAALRTMSLYSETRTVRQILTEMLADLERRRQLYIAELADARARVDDDSRKLVEWRSYAAENEVSPLPPKPCLARTAVLYVCWCLKHVRVCCFAGG